ncbi:MAG TPA: DNA-processing protein DprA, partial [Sphingomonadaceae bacterium]|nr:DNA-processing protein DprA [Sphingomonadaceae bacterium]
MSATPSPGHAISQAEAFARIRLLRSPNVGPVSYAQLLRRFGSAEQAIEALPDLASRGTQSYRPAPSGLIEAEIDATRRAGARYLFHDSPDYPALLAQVEGAPPILVVQGDTALFARPCVALVGARNASAAAIKLARQLASELSAE